MHAVLVLLVYEGVEEYSCKYFAARKEKLKLSENQQGPLVCRHNFPVHACAVIIQSVGAHALIF